MAKALPKKKKKKFDKTDGISCWKQLTKHKKQKINFFVLDLSIKKGYKVINAGNALSLSDIFTQDTGRVYFIRIDCHETGNYDEEVVKGKFVFFQMTKKGQKAIKTAKHNNKRVEFLKDAGVNTHWDQS